MQSVPNLPVDDSVSHSTGVLRLQISLEFCEGSLRV